MKEGSRVTYYHLDDEGDAVGAETGTFDTQRLNALRKYSAVRVVNGKERETFPQFEQPSVDAETLLASLEIGSGTVFDRRVPDGFFDVFKARPREGKSAEF